MANPTFSERMQAQQSQLAGQSARPQSPARPKRQIGVHSGPKSTPWAILVYGPEGVGKSSLALDIDGHAVVDTEQSSNRLNTTKLELDGQPPRNLGDVYELVDYLFTQDHPHRTLVIDTIDRLEAMIFADVVAKAQKRQGGAQIHGIEDFGFGKGYQVALDEWRRLVARLDELRTVRNINVLLLGHCLIKPFRNPDGPDYDRYVLKVNEKAAGFLKEWCDAVLFARFAESTTKVENRIKGVMDGSRVLHSVRAAAYDAKNRFGMPETLGLSWREVESAMQMKGASHG